MVAKRRIRALAGTAVALLTALSLAPSAGMAATHADATPGRKPTVVLVHGGWADASGWNEEVTRLHRLGYPVIAPADPLRGLAPDAAYLRSILRTIKTPIVLVGHSYGGAVITNAAVGVPNVKALVYIAGFAPDEGESLVGLVGKNPGTLIGPRTLTTRPYPTTDGKPGTDLYLTQEGIRTAFAGDLPARTADRLWATQRPFSQAAFDSESGAPAWRTTPSWYLVATQDEAIPPATQRFMAARAHATVAQVRASHVAMISQPAATTRLILRAAHAAAR
jgi:pimeloyl-ACP methyl ester carboxylesterase